MNQAPHARPINSYLIHPRQIEQAARRFFSADDLSVEPVMSGISTYVYRIISRRQTYYLRVLPETGASFAPEIAVLTLLRQNHVSVPEVIYFEEYNDTLRRPFMIEREVAGLALSRSAHSKETLEGPAMEAGRDLARINKLAIAGFGWIEANREHPACLRARWPTYRAFVLEYREADLAYLSKHVLNAQERAALERVLARYDGLLDSEEGYLAHGDFDTTHIFQDHGRYTGIIDFGEARGTSHWYDLAHFRIRDGAFPPYRLFPALERGYAEITSLPPAYDQQLRFTSVLINIRALARAFQTRPPDRYIWRQLETLHEDVTASAPHESSLI
jgi:aminoglycoside phosphotransferase (APT) family kinase protein